MNINNAHPFYITNHLLICLLHYQQSIWPSTYPRGVQYKLLMCFFWPGHHTEALYPFGTCYSWVHSAHLWSDFRGDRTTRYL